MSVPRATIRCNKCSFSTSFVSWPYVICLYRLRDGTTAQVDRHRAWCRQCRNFAPVEHFPAPDEARAAMFKAADRLRRHTARNPVSLLRRLGASWEKRRFALEKVAKEAEAFYAVVSTRTSPPRCLQCGHTSHEPLELPAAVPDGVLQTNVRHPGCPGTFILDATSKGRFSLAGVVRYLGPEGDLLEESKEDYDAYHRAWADTLRFS